MYKRISDIRTPEDMSDVRDELIDRFGEPPRATERLLSVAFIRSVMELAKISRVTEGAGRLNFFADRLEMEVLSELLPLYNGRLYGQSSGPALVLKLSRGEDSIEALTELMTSYYNIRRSNA